jgi:hypothetical protein
MAEPRLLDTKVPTKNPQPRRADRHARPQGKARRTAHGTPVRGDAREGTRGNGRTVVEVVGGGGLRCIRRGGRGDRWRAVWYEGGVRRQCQAVSEERLAARLEKVSERLGADAANMERSGAELIAYFLSPDRHPPGRQWSRKHAHTQGRLCERFVAPVIGGLVCEDIKTGHLQAVVNAAPTAQEGKRLREAAADTRLWLPSVSRG